MLWFVFLYLICGLLLTLWVIWRGKKADPSPLFEDGERLFAVIGFVLMVLTWPLWLYAFLEAHA